jgi:hypothetical protein
MLSDAQKKFIAAEEEFRHEVKKKLMGQAEVQVSNPAAQNPAIESEKIKTDSKLMEFLNSSFGTWFISSVLVSGGAGLYQQIEHHYEERKLQQAQFSKYKFEIENRIDHMQVALRQATTVGQAKEALKRLHKAQFPLIPELENSGLESMYLNVYDLLSGSSQERAKQAIEFVRQLEDSEVLLEPQDDKQIISPADKAQVRKLVKAIKDLHFNQAQGI